jgi:ketosteroid isomerase-like protein
MVFANLALAQPIEEPAVIAVAQAAADAFREGNIEALEQLLTPDFTSVDAASRVASRADVIAAMRAGALRYEVFQNRDMKARIYGDAAVIVGTTSAKGTWMGQPFSAELRFTDVLLRMDRKWKLVATHATRLPSPQPPP